MNNLTKRSKTVRGAVVLVVCVMVGFACPAVQAAGLLKPTNGGNENDVFLKSHKVKVSIINGFARTEVDQVFTNTTSRDLEAIYSFPIPKDASLSELSLWIDGKEVIGEVMERKQARQLYDKEVRKKIDPALAEKNSHKTFDIAVYPVVANDDTRLRLVYYQPLEIDLNIGRYVYPLEDIGEDGQEQSFWSVNNSVKADFSFELTLSSAFPIANVRMPGYDSDAAIEKISKPNENGEFAGDVYKANMSSEEGYELNKDIVFYYKLDDTTPARIELVPFKKDKKSTGTFMAVVTPAAELSKISTGNDWVFTLDVSGSMAGAKLSTLIEGVANAVSNMNENDRFKVFAFSNDVRELTNGYTEATAENIQKVTEKIRNLQANGGTRVLPAIKRAFENADKARPTAVVLVTDGNIAINKETYSQYIALMDEHDIRIFVMLTGNGSNNTMMKKLAKDSGGFLMNISTTDDIAGRILQAKNHIGHEALKSISLDITGTKVKNLTPAYTGSLYHGQQMIVFGQYEKGGPIDIELKATLNGENKIWKCSAELPEVDTDNPELERLWALSAIEDVVSEIKDEGETDARKEEIIKLGKDYSLVTDYTSMIVLTEARFKELNVDRKNQRRVESERKAQEERRNQPVKNYRVDNNGTSNSGGTQSNNTFEERRSPGIGIGTGPVGPLFVAAIVWMRKRDRK